MGRIYHVELQPSGEKIKYASRSSAVRAAKRMVEGSTEESYSVEVHEIAELPKYRCTIATFKKRLTKASNTTMIQNKTTQERLESIAIIAFNSQITDSEKCYYDIDAIAQHPTEENVYLVSAIAYSWDNEDSEAYVTAIVYDDPIPESFCLKDWQMPERITTWDDVKDNQDMFVTPDGKDPVWLNGLPILL